MTNSEPRPWYANYALFPDRERPTYIVAGFTPPPGTTPAQVAELRWWTSQKAPNHRLLYADERAALYEVSQRYIGGHPAPPLREVAIRYDDLNPKRDQYGGPLWPGEDLTRLVQEWLERVPPIEEDAA